ncbi:hypothetical protein BM613_00870 [Sulfoacidibacillus thermotolerans]|uniref:MoaB/Mog domain-containing protein n=2 Tax=Sulfoacidibacillus thermotolerans TaxID=1765684 RepID=A0A2U3DCI2_SULT2|nr:hypothetical protein BM613_00870 [Sulfoacidibacillus thermotolerans]
MFQVAVVTVSDSSYRGERIDKGGPAVTKAVIDAGFEVVSQILLPDEQAAIEAALRELVGLKIPLILTTGGTGLSSRDVTPEATRQVIEREVPGLAEEMRRQGLAKTRFALLSRAVAGTCESSLIINLPGNPEGAVESLQAIIDTLTHALRVLTLPAYDHTK